MKYAFASALAALMIAGAAIAQTTPPTPATPAAPMPVPASACPAYPAAPPLPAAEAIRNQRELDAATALVNTHINQWNTVQACRVPEVERLLAQYNARVAEAKAGGEAVKAVSDQWKATGEAVVARGAAKQKDGRTGRQ